MKAVPLIVHLPDTRGVTLSPFGSGNRKLGVGVYTYSRLPGRGTFLGTCPGSTLECESICYAKRVTGIVRDLWAENSKVEYVPDLPADCALLRIHVSGDFDTKNYIQQWINRLMARPDVTAWAYTRSWRVPALLPLLEELRALPNMQLFASMDPSTPDVPPMGWRRAWIKREAPNRDRLDDGDMGAWPVELRLQGEGDNLTAGTEHPLTEPGSLVQGSQWTLTPAYVCPEETGRKPDCVSCGYCFEGQKHDVVFLEHKGKE
jgi:hypothetical protein